MRLASFAALALATTVQAAPAVVDLATLKAGDRSHGFEATAVYLDAADRPMGARFMHRPTGFQLDLLRIESVPQAFTWVKTFATSDQGEPHTQEHLLLLRGIRGRTLATKESMSLVTSSAYTETWRTSYFFNTGAGVDTFFDIFAEQQRAMLHPDYSDAEIRLEVRNFGVTKSADGTPAPGREGHGLQRDGGLDGQRQLAGLAGAEPRALRQRTTPCRTTRAASPRASGR